MLITKRCTHLCFFLCDFDKKCLNCPQTIFSVQLVKIQIEILKKTTHSIIIFQTLDKILFQLRITPQFIVGRLIIKIYPLRVAVGDTKREKNILLIFNMLKHIVNLILFCLKSHFINFPMLNFKSLFIIKLTLSLQLGNKVIRSGLCAFMHGY